MKRIMMGMALWGLMAGSLWTPVAGAEEAVKAPRPGTDRVTVRVQHEEGRSKDRVMIGRNLVVGEEEVVPDAVVVMGSADIQGEVSGDLVVVMGSAKLGPRAYVKGDTVVIGGTLDLDTGAKIRGERVVIGLGSLDSLGFGWLKDWLEQGLYKGRPIAPALPWIWVVLGVLLLLNAALVVTFPKSMARCVDTVTARPLPSFFAGILGAMLLGPIVFMLLISVAGIVVIPFVGCGVLGMYMMGKAAVGRAVGGSLLRIPSQESRIGYALGAAVLGTGVCYALFAVPYAGLIVWGLVTPIGFGAVVITMMDYWKGRKTASNNPQPGTPMPSGGTDSPAGTPDLSAMTRATIGDRLVAFLIDVAICAMLSKLLSFGMAWLVYHAAFWGWKGTTLGGMVMSLKGVRIDGKPMDFPVGVVRSLASILSMVVVGLGYVWALWDPEGRTWHDKIAGTMVVKAPKGVSLI